MKTNKAVIFAGVLAAVFCLGPAAPARAFWTDGGQGGTALDQLGLAADIDERFGTSGELADIVAFHAASDRPLPAKPADGGAAFLDEAAAGALKAIAAADDSPFGAVGGGNRGLSAYRLITRAANRTAWLVEASFPGINLGGKEYSDFSPQLILVITSDDEPAAHMYEQDRVSGKLSRVADFSLTDACERLGSNRSLLEKIVPGADPDTLAWPVLLNGLLGAGNSSPVSLGGGSAKPYWWTK